MSTAELEQSAADPAAESDEFDQAFKEFAGQDDDAPEGAAQDDAPEPEAPADAPEPKREANQPTVESLMAELEATRKAAQDFEHRFKSEVGRQTAYQRQIQELKAQLQSLPQQAATQAQQKRLSDRMAKIAEDFPELAEVLQEELNSVVSSVRQELDQNLQPIRQREQETYYQMEEQRVAQTYPDFAEVVRSTDFQRWFSEQPEAVRQLASSPYAQDAIAVLDYYTGGARFKQQQAEPNPAVNQVQARRQAAMERNVSVKNSAPAPVSDAPDDFESAFNFYARRLGKK